MFLSVQEFMTFTSQLIVERSAKGSRASVKEQGKRLAEVCAARASHLGSTAPHEHVHPTRLLAHSLLLFLSIRLPCPLVNSKLLGYSGPLNLDSLKMKV